jgi:hypothetical protein
MKKIFLPLSFIFPLHLIAQPTINHMLDYHAGQVDSFVSCSFMPPGSGGPSQTWNFASLVTTGSGRFEYMANPTGSPISNANLARKGADSTYAYYSITSNKTYTVGNAHFNPTTYVTTYLDTLLAGERPITYNDAFSDAFRTSQVFGGSGGTTSSSGKYTLTVDGYGTLTLPNATYTNALRTFATDTIYDTSSVNGVDTQIYHFYRWYDDLHAYPLLDIDSTWLFNSSGRTYHIATTYMLVERTDISKIENKHSNFNAVFNNDQLLISGDIDAGKKYQVLLLTISGQRIFSADIVAKDGINIITVNNYLAQGIYIVLLKEPFDPAVSIQKVLKE